MSVLLLFVGRLIRNVYFLYVLLLVLRQTYQNLWVLWAVFEQIYGKSACFLVICGCCRFLEQLYSCSYFKIADGGREEQLFSAFYSVSVSISAFVTCTIGLFTHIMLEGR